MPLGTLPKGILREEGVGEGVLMFFVVVFVLVFVCYFPSHLRFAIVWKFVL